MWQNLLGLIQLSNTGDITADQITGICVPNYLPGFKIRENSK
jgi:hypothetical protein